MVRIATAELSQVEIEQLAREKAVRLLTPTQRAEENQPPRAPARPPEPSLEERMAAIDRRAREHAEALKRALAARGETRFSLDAAGRSR